MQKFSFLFLFLIFTLSVIANTSSDEREYKERTHVVQPKETLYKISRQHGVSITSIRKANNIKGDIISAGARLKVRIPKENNVFQIHIVRVDESIEVISDKYLLPLDILTKYNELDDKVVFPGQRIFIKIDKINTKYTYKGEEDLPLTDAEIGDTQNDFNVSATGSNPVTQPNTNQNTSANASANNTPAPIYKLNTAAPPIAILKDSLNRGDKAFTIDGYLDAYYAQFSDRENQGDLTEYAMSAPRHNQTGINTIQLSGIYRDTGLRGNITLQYGDIVDAVYPTDLKYIQQANVGFKLLGNLWVDAGFFNSPISVESFSNRNNYNSINSYTRYFEPVLISGAKLSWEAKSIKFSVFGSDRSFMAGSVVNTQPSFGANLKIYGGKHWLFGANGMYSKMKLGTQKVERTNANIFLASNRKHFDFLAIGNYISQQNKSVLSGVLNIRYKISPKFALFGKGEYFADSSALLTPLMTNNEGKQQGFNSITYGGGIEFKARKNHYLRVEARSTQLENGFDVYKDYFNGGNATNQRLELVITTGIWFGK
jgi:LysM repeat protein